MTILSRTSKTETCAHPGWAVLPAAMLMAILGITACTQPSRTQGVQLYQDLCVACHGETGQGDGPLAADLDVPVADLTLISARNGGTFPMAEVMSTIDGYSRAQHGNLAMPEFGAFLEDSPTVAFDSGDGIPTPTPSALVALAEYVESLQRAP